MGRMKDKKQMLDEWFDKFGDWCPTMDVRDASGNPVTVSFRLSVNEIYKMFKLGIELGYEPGENNDE